MRRVSPLPIAVALAVLAVVGLGLAARLWLRPAPATVTNATEYEAITTLAMAAPITVWLPAEQAVLTGVAFRAFDDVDASMSEWKPTSPLSAVNRAAGGAGVPVPPDLLDVIRRGLEIGEMTDGAFAVTWAALWGLWDFTGAAPKVPDALDIERRVALVDDRGVEIDEAAGTVRLAREGMMIGLGGIAKGYALELAAARLQEKGVESAMISAGGQMMLIGGRGERGWRVGIRDPRGDRDDHFAYLELRDVSVSTSGDYERFFVEDGVRYHHILDPRTGRPARAGVRSATVVSADATLADALSTALVILGVERGIELVEGLPGVEAVLVDDRGGVHVTSGLAGRLEITHPPRP